MPADADWVFSDPVIMDRSLIRNAVSFEISNRIGRYAPRTRFAEAFLVDDGGEVRLAKYLGFYTVIEKIKRGRERVNIDKLEVTEVAPPDITGGYIVSIDKGGPISWPTARSFNTSTPTARTWPTLRAPRSATTSSTTSKAMATRCFQPISRTPRPAAITPSTSTSIRSSITT